MKHVSWRGLVIPLVVFVVSGVVGTRPAGAQESDAVEARFALDRYRAAETPEDGFALSRPNDLGHLRFSAHLHFDYAYNPLTWEQPQGSREYEIGAPVAHQLVGTLGLSLGLWSRLLVFAGLPLNLYMASDTPDGLGDAFAALAADGTALGDFFFGARVRIVGENDDTFGLGFQATVTAPTATAADETQRFAGDPNFTGQFEFLLEVRPTRVRITANIGARVREGADFGSFESFHELTYGGGMTIIAADWLHIMGEVYGSAPFSSDIMDRESRPIEGILGMRFYPGAGISFGFAGGAGFNRGVGSPQARGVFTLGWHRPPPPECEDNDQDHICHTVDRCPEEAEDFDQFEDEDGCPDPDNDQDGILDADDGPNGSCRNDPEDRDDFQDEDGCPDTDNDQDGILDDADGPGGSCRNNPEDVDQFEDEDGCPDTDNDQDGVIDEVDGPDGSCRNDPEDRDNFEDADGCPDPDNDQDRILDASDGPGGSCRNDPEDADGFEDEDGCPDPDNDQDTVLDVNDDCPLAPGPPDNRGCPRAIRVEAAQIVILQRIEFEFDSDVLRPSAFPILDEVRGVLAVNQQIRRIRVEGHTDSQGADDYNMDLSQRRAESVRRWLVEHGIEMGRMDAQGFGETRPIANNRTRDGRQTNRRVEFHIVDPAPPADSE